MAVMAKPREPFDLAVVGAGIVGAMVALLARRRHPEWRIVLADRSLAGHGATRYSAFLDVPLAPTPGKRALTERSRVLYDELRRELPSLPLRELPAVFVSSEGRAPRLAGEIVADRESPLRPLDAALAASLAPDGFRLPTGSVALGGVRAVRADDTLVRTLVDELRARPSTVCVEGVEVASVVGDGGGRQLLTTHDGRTWSARRTALCLGPWLGSSQPRIAGLPRKWRVKKVAALHVPIAPRSGSAVVYLADEEAFFLPQPEQRRFLFSFRSDQWDCEPDAAPLRIDPRDWSCARAIMKRYMDVVDMDLGGVVYCDAYGADAVPSVEPLDGVPGAFAVGGGAGSGFRLAPALAERALQALEELRAGGVGPEPGLRGEAAVLGREEADMFDVVADPAIADDAVTSLFDAVYVKGGYTAPAIAERLFSPASVRSRGTTLAAIGRQSGALLGAVIVVPPGNHGRQISVDGEAELHLLAVRPDARRRGVGRALVRDALRFAEARGWRRVVLSTQRQMTEAQALYAAAGFQRRPERDWTRWGSHYLAYDIELTSS
ncbi:hypothetical protein BE20_36920 [Sorangium cellulosum]|uniref:N-acetyltransferase domain-containing protein n=1 Tax=Sorangium cellulosum TaxID=56 RepID=A0A150SF45_SORCE|nr:hypothetical protein BE18_04630 [Sorangium cellulosum]KYF97893.1 hypothetical protein BE20_36920 [Sorangium cellulosum]